MPPVSDCSIISFALAIFIVPEADDLLTATLSLRSSVNPDEISIDLTRWKVEVRVEIGELVTSVHSLAASQPVDSSHCCTSAWAEIPTMSAFGDAANEWTEV